MSQEILRVLELIQEGKVSASQGLVDGKLVDVDVQDPDEVRMTVAIYVELEKLFLDFA